MRARWRSRGDCEKNIEVHINRRGLTIMSASAQARRAPSRHHLRRALRQSHADCYSYTDGHSNRYSPTHAHAEISADAEAASDAKARS
jgi:hypothetical protein